MTRPKYKFLLTRLMQWVLALNVCPPPYEDSGPHRPCHNTTPTDADCHKCIMGWLEKEVK